MDSYQPAFASTFFSQCASRVQPWLKRKSKCGLVVEHTCPWMEAKSKAWLIGSRSQVLAPNHLAGYADWRTGVGLAMTYLRIIRTWAMSSPVAFSHLVFRTTKLINFILARNFGISFLIYDHFCSYVSQSFKMGWDLNGKRDSPELA